MTDQGDIEWDPLRYKHQQVADTIRERIKDGTYPPGTILSEVRFEQEFRVSRPTIRTAMRTLRAEGLIVTMPNRGSIVVPRGDVLD